VQRDPNRVDISRSRAAASSEASPTLPLGSVDSIVMAITTPFSAVSKYERKSLADIGPNPDNAQARLGKIFGIRL